MRTIHRLTRLKIENGPTTCMNGCMGVCVVTLSWSLDRLIGAGDEPAIAPMWERVLSYGAHRQRRPWAAIESIFLPRLSGLWGHNSVGALGSV